MWRRHGPRTSRSSSARWGESLACRKTTSRPPPGTFGVKIGGEPILNVPSAGSFQSGITFAMTAAGLVAPFEEHEARVTAGYNLLEWRSLDPHDRALEVAHFRLRKD